jgi:hypothetical protein
MQLQNLGRSRGKASGATTPGRRVQRAEKWEAKLFGIKNYFLLSTNFK